MKTSENPNKGILRIEQGENISYKVVFEPVDATVWLRKVELPALFGVYLQTINACVESIFKEKLFDKDRVSKYDLYASGNKIKYDMREFRLEVIIAMAFRIDSPNARILREWVIGRCMYSGISDCLPPETGQQAGLN